MKEGVAISQLADILPPPPPGGPDWMLLGIIAIVSLLAVAALWWFMKKHYSQRNASPAREAQRRLITVHKAWQARRLSDREAAYRLATLLRLGLAVPQLKTHLRPNSVEDDASWRETLQQLSALRYREVTKAGLSSQCFERTARWLAAAQRRGN